jgi:hypothetical protein
MGGMDQVNRHEIRAELRRMCLDTDDSEVSDDFLVRELRALSLQCRPCHPGALQDPEYHDANLFGEWELREWVGDMTFNAKIKEVWQKIKDTEENKLWRFPTNFDRSRRQPQNGGGGSRGGSGQKPPCVACFSIILKHTPRYRYIYDLWDTDDTNNEERLVVLRNMLRVKKQGAPPKNEGLNNNKRADDYRLGVAWDDLSVMLRTKSDGNDNGSANGIFIDDADMYERKVLEEQKISWDDVRQWFFLQHQGVHVNTPVQANVKEWVQRKSELLSRILHETEDNKGKFFLGLKLCNKHAAQVREIWPDTIIVPTKNKDPCKYKLADGSECERKKQGYSLNGNIVCATCMFDNAPALYATQFANKYKGKGNRANYKQKERTVLKDVRSFLCNTDSEADERVDTVVTVDTPNSFNEKITVRGYNQSVGNVETADGKNTFFIPDLIVHVHGNTSEAAVTKVIVFEIDELQHRVYNLSRELTREQLICQKLAETHKLLTHIHIVRFNPDGYRYTTDAYPESGESGEGQMGMYGAPGPYKNMPPALTPTGDVKDDGKYNTRIDRLKDKLTNIINEDDNSEFRTEMERTYLSNFKRKDKESVVCRKTHLFYDEGFSNASPDENTVNIHSINIGKKK